MTPITILLSPNLDASCHCGLKATISTMGHDKNGEVSVVNTCDTHPLPEVVAKFRSLSGEVDMMSEPTEGIPF